MSRPGFLRAKSPEERRRLYEIVGIVVTTILLIVISRLESRLFELSEKLSSNQDFFVSVVYFGLINLNVLLILVLSFLIFRNVVKLVVERRRGVLGSRLRTKLVVTLVFFAVAPTAVLFYISTRYITTSFDTWFSVKVRDTMQQTREAGALVYKQDQRRLESLARIALQRVDLDEPTEQYPGALALPLPGRLDGFESEYRLYGVKLYDRNGKLVWSSHRQDPDVGHAASDSFVYEAIERFSYEPGLVSKGAVATDDTRDVVKGAAPVLDPRNRQLVGIVIAEERFETQILRSIEAILTEFANIRPGAQLIRLSFMILLVVMVLIIIFSATWLGFYVARGITGPIQSLAEATREVALGNYNITLMPRSDDETGQLVRSFNRMTKDLQQHRSQVDESQNRLHAINDELEQRRQYMEVVLKNITAGVVAVDPQEKITSVNNAAEKLLGIVAADLVGKSVREGLGEQLWSDLWQPVVERLGIRNSFSGQMDVATTGGELSLLVDASRIFDEASEQLGIILVFDDASEQAKVQRVAAWREVARRIAHEIKNPITPIKLSAQRLLRRFGGQFQGDDADVFKSCIETILVQVDSLRNLVNEFSKFSRLPSITTTPEDINELVNDVARLYGLSYPDVSFDTSGLDRSIPKIPIDKEQMHRVLVNIVSNAVAACTVDTSDKKIAFRTSKIDDINTMRLEICDNGPGIPDNIKAKVLEPYFSTKEDGTGLGLTIVNQIVSDHGGYLRLTDHEPRGTKVVIELPLTPPPADGRFDTSAMRQI